MASQFSNFTKKELLGKLKKQKTFIFIQSIVIFLMILLSIFSTLDQGVSFQTFLPLFFIPMLFVMVLEFNKIKKELNSRN